MNCRITVRILIDLVHINQLTINDMMKFEINRCKIVSSLKVTGLILMFILCSGVCSAQKKSDEQQFTSIEYAPFSDNTNHWYSVADKHNMINALPDRPRYKPTEIIKIADNMLLFQKENGGWPKNYDFFAILSDSQRESVKQGKNLTNTTFDNGNTYTQIAALAIAYKATGIEKYKAACLKGLDFVLKAQYANGGWPQYYPLEKNNYSSHITYNDGAMVGIMILLKDILDGKPAYTFIDNSFKTKLQKAYDKGLDCILKTQIVDNGKLTVWCQQHDEVTLQPAWARKFEPAAICSQESAELVAFLMSINHPDQRIIKAIESAVSWFEESKIYNTRVDKVPASSMQTPYRLSKFDRVVVYDSTAPPVWTRYYELKTHRPLFCNRDSKVVYSLAEVERERRDGYAWYNYSPQKILNKYPKWKQKLVSGNDVLKAK